jgi:hypothetical protein
MQARHKFVSGHASAVDAPAHGWHGGRLPVPVEKEKVPLRRPRARTEYRRVRVARRAKPRARPGPARRVCEAPGVPLMP